MQAGGPGFESPHLHQQTSRTLDQIVALLGYPGRIFNMNASKPGGKFLASPEQLYEDFLNFKKSTRGITPKSEDWFKDTVWTFLKSQPVTVDVTRLTTSDIATFLGRYNDKPHSKHSFYRALRLFYQWISTTYKLPNPFIDEFGNPVIRPPRIPEKALPTMDPNTAFDLIIQSIDSPRDVVIISLLMESGARRSEMANIKVDDLDLENRRIQVIGKGGKLGWLIFGERTHGFLQHYLNESQPTDSLFGLSSDGIKTMLRRLENKTGVKCNAHTFRRGFATELRKKGLNELDIAELGRWNSTAMVKRYTRKFEFEDAAARYQDII